MRIVYRLIILSLFLMLLILIRNESPILETISNYSIVTKFIIGLLAMFVWFFGRYSRFFTRSLTNLYVFWLIMLLWLAIVPLLFFEQIIDFKVFYQGMFHDYSYLLFSLFPFFLVTDASHDYYNKVFNKVGFAAVFLGILAIILVDKSFNSVSTRAGTWTLSYYFWWIVICVYPYFYLKNAFLIKDSKGNILIILHILFCLFFLKRSGIINAILLVSLSTIFSGKSGKLLKIMGVTFILFVSIFIFFGQYLDLLLIRFESDTADIAQQDRLMEAEEFFSKITFEEFITGFGMNNYINMYYIGVKHNALNSLHIGFYNLIYKGGILYVLFNAYLAIKIISLNRFINKNPEIKIGFIIGVMYLISFTYENGWSYFPIHFFSLLPIYRAIYLKDFYVDSNRIILK